MKRPGWMLAPLLLALSLPATLARAQWDPSTQEGTSTTTAPTPPPVPPGQMVSETPIPDAQQPSTAKGFQPASFTWSLGIGVPIILDVPRDVVRPGANVFFFGGADFGFFIVGGSAGLQWNPIVFKNFRPPGSTAVLNGRRPLTRIYLSAPEVRFQVPNLEVVLPYVSFAFDMNFWNFQETAIACGYWYCSSVAVYRFTPGFTGKGGLGFNINQSGVHIDVGFQYSFTGKGNLFEDSGWWLTPYVGVLVRR